MTNKNKAASIKEDEVQRKKMDEHEKLQALFAKETGRLVLFDPDAGLSGSSTVFSKYTREQLNGWLQNPGTISNEKSLRDASIYMSVISPQYSRLISYYAGLLKWVYTISPVRFDGFSNDSDKEVFTKNYYKTANILEAMEIPDMMQTIMTVVLREGVFFGCRWKSDSATYVQRINPDFCRISSIQDGVFLFKVDMSKIKPQTLPGYPPEFEKMLANSRKEGESNWQEVAPEISICLKFDPSISFSAPAFASVMPQLYRLADSEERSDVNDEQENYKFLYLEMPTDSEGKPKMEYDEYQKYYKHIAGGLGSRIGAGGSPMKPHVITFDRSGTAAEVDKQLQATEHFYRVSGSAAQIHGVNASSASALKLAMKVDEEFVQGLMLQAQKVINRILRTEVAGKYKFRIDFIPVTIFNRQDYLDEFSRSASLGIGIKEYAAILGKTQYTLLGSSVIENEILKLDEIFKPLKNTYNTASGNKDAGRPAKDDLDLEDAGEITKESEGNENRE